MPKGIGYGKLSPKSSKTRKAGMAKSAKKSARRAGGFRSNAIRSVRHKRGR